MSDFMQLDHSDWKKWAKNTAIFFAPAGLIFLNEIQRGASVDVALIALKTWVLSTSIDLLRKLLATPRT